MRLKAGVFAGLLLSGPGGALAQDAPAETPETPETPEAPPQTEDGAPELVDEIAWKDHPIDYRYETDFTSYTLDKGSARLGLINLDYGLLDNFQIGTSPLLDVYGVITLRGKITALSMPRFDVSIESTVAHYDASKFAAINNLGVWTYPVSLRSSWAVSDRWSIHSGFKWHIIDVVGEFNFDTLGETLAPVIGLRLPPETKQALGQAGSVYAGAHITLGQLEIATDWRFNRRDSLVLVYHGYAFISGVIDAGVQAEGGGSIAGVAYRVPNRNLFKEVPGTTTLSWQWSYEHFAFRVGIPLSTPKSVAEDYTPLVWVGQGMAIYWIL